MTKLFAVFFSAAVLGALILVVYTGWHAFRIGGVALGFYIFVITAILAIIAAQLALKS